MELATFRDYKSVLKARIQELRGTRSGLTLKRLAEKIPIQYTYLSKVLNDRSIHLGEDDLFRASELLGFFPQEIDYILLLRAHQTAVLPARREFAAKKLSAFKKDLQVNAKVEAGDSTRLTREMAYLLDPFAIIVFISLQIPAVRQDPRALCATLGLTLAKLKELLKTLSLLDLIEMGTGPLSVTGVKQNRIHYSKEHPLMRVHQHLFKTSTLNQLLKLSEDEKESFQVTFSADSKAYGAIREEFRSFLTKVEDIARGSRKDERVLQMNFDLFYWF